MRDNQRVPELVGYPRLANSRDDADVNNARLPSGWHYSKQLNCFVNGHLTDNSCTKGKYPNPVHATPREGIVKLTSVPCPARMGYCDWNDADKSAAKHFG